MLFEMKLAGKTMYSTYDPDCVYPDSQIKQMMQSGYKAYKDGKQYRPKSRKQQPETQLSLF